MSRQSSRKSGKRLNRNVASAAPRPEIAQRRIPEPVVVEAENSIAKYPATSRRTTWLTCLLLAAVTFAAYSAVLKHPFVNYDDEDYVIHNVEIQKGLTAASVKWAFTSTSHSNWHPLTWLSHMLDYDLFALNAHGHHFTSLMFHVANVVLLYLFLARVTGARWRSLLVAALFAIHPINVESVAWVSERKNVLSMFFFLLTLIAYAWYARRPNFGCFAVALAGFALGLAAKPQIVTLPFVLILLDYWPLQRYAKWKSPSSSFPAPQYNLGLLLAEKIPFFLLAFASSIITMLAQQGAIYSTAALPFWPRLTNAVFAYFEYLWKTIWPLHLAAFYPHWGRLVSWWQVALAAAFLIVVSVHAWRRRARGYWITGWLWFLGTLVPMIGLVQAGQQGMADRYAYLPLIGVFILAVWAIADFGEKLRLKPRAFIAISALVLVSLLILTVRQVATWASSYDLWAHALKVTDSNYVAEDFIGAAILLDQYKATGQRYSDEAAAHFRNAVRFDPDDTLGRLNLGADYHERGQLQEAIAQYQIAYRTAQSYDLLKKACTDLAAVYELLGDFESARQYYRQALQITPGDPILLTNLGRLRMSQRVSELAKSAQEHPSADTYWQLGRLQRDLGQLSNAKSSFEHALKLAPTFTEARQALNDISQPGTHQD